MFSLPEIELVPNLGHKAGQGKHYDIKTLSLIEILDRDHRRRSSLY